MPKASIPSPTIRSALENSAREGLLSFADFMEVALYNPQDGYYTHERRRVGKTRDTDFYTASSFPDIFAPILLEASAAMLTASGKSPADFHWIEIGSEPDAALMAQRATPFKSTRAIRIGDPIESQGNCVVFSNELFDAQAFHSVVFENGHWRERCLSIDADGLEFTTRNQFSHEIEPYLTRLPKIATEGYTIDIPTRSVDLLDRICQQPWQGAFIAFDYGKTWQAISYDTPQGTARAYKQHRQISGLHENASQQDLTCHICWDFLEEGLRANRFSNLALESQESFVIRRAPDFLAACFDPQHDALSKQRSQLKQLIHPSLMGQKFQALSALRLPTKE